jgi:subtilase family serine protease
MSVPECSSARRPGRGCRRRVQTAAFIAAALALAGCASSTAARSTAAGSTATDTTSRPAGYGCLPKPPGLMAPCYYSPQLFRAAYGVTPLLDRGIDGRGQTVVLPEAAQAPGTLGASDIRQDLALFDRLYALPAANLKVITSFAGAASPYLAANEEVEDAEMVHAIAPGAAIAIILLPAASNGGTNNTEAFTSELAEALRLAPRLGAVVSVSAGRGEGCATAAEVTELNGALRADQEQQVTVIAASGDEGAASAPCTGSQGAAPAPVKGVNLPASDPLVLAVGGTSLRADHDTGAYQGEVAWNTPTPASLVSKLPPGLEPAVASGGGFSRLFSRPAYQAGVPGSGASRGVPDVAASASPYTGMAVALEYAGQQIVAVADGTSASAPFWAGIIALADQSAGRHLGFINPAIYRIARESRAAFHDVTTGDNTVHYPGGTVNGYSAGPGWDPVTGWGSPDAQVLVPLLAADG